ncbi:MAG: CNNM domain-containing protein [Candidatus Azobacteroides sp.]|nr:CNNM domain-containing protein [Candidatus Azobacteroides sp.]
MKLLLLYLFIALFTSFLCSIAEAVLLSTPIAYLKVKVAAGDKGAERLYKLKENVDKPLSAILSLNTVAHTVGAAGVGAQAIQLWGEAYFGIVSAILTILILILTEIIPKTIGANYFKQLVGFVSRIIKGMIFITYPLVIVSAYLTRLLSKKGAEYTTSREEISLLADIGTQEGIFGENENKIIQNLIKLKSVKVSEIMTPRVVVVAAEEEMTLEEFLKNKDFLHFSRIPIYEERKDNITGYVFRQMVFEKLAEDQFNLRLKDIKRDIVMLAATTSLYNAWEILLEKREHIALILDEYGGMAGIATMEDVIETLLGFEIIDEKDIVTDMQQFATERWKARQRKYDMLNKSYGRKKS